MAQIVVTIDFHNAFNSLDRNALLTACWRDFPTPAAWAPWCYSGPSRPLYNERVVDSTAGVQQGDDLGPLHFITSMQEAKGHGESPTGCGGIPAVGLTFQVHSESKTSPSMMGTCYRLHRCRKGFTWCYKVGVNSCSDCRQQHIPQFCGSCWGARLSVCSAVDFSSFCVFVVGLWALPCLESCPSWFMQPLTTVWLHTMFLCFTTRAPVWPLGRLLLQASTRRLSLLSEGWFHALVQRCKPPRSGICFLGEFRVPRARLVMQWRRHTVFCLEVPAVVVRTPRHCKKHKVTVSHFQVAVSTLPSDLFSGLTWGPSRRRQSWYHVAGCAVVGRGFAWCNKDGGYYCSDSRKRHILQFCGSSWAHGAVPALADRIEYARGETGLDINPSAQHLLNCDLRGNHFRSRLLLSSLASPEEFTWCNKDGMHSFTESRKQRIPQFCGSCWSLRSVSDRFQFVRGEKGIDINPSVQHLLNCGGVRGCHGGSFPLCSSMKTPHSFLPGSPRSGCSNSASLQEATRSL